MTLMTTTLDQIASVHVDVDVLNSEFLYTVHLILQ